MYHRFAQLQMGKDLLSFRRMDRVLKGLNKVDMSNIGPLPRIASPSSKALMNCCQLGYYIPYKTPIKEHSAISKFWLANFTNDVRHVRSNLRPFNSL